MRRKEIAIECIKFINKYKLKRFILFKLFNNKNYVFQFRNIQASFNHGTYELLERYYRMKGYKCDAIESKKGSFIISSIKTKGSKSFFNHNNK